MFAIVLVSLVLVFAALNAYSEYENSKPYDGPMAERYTSMKGELCYLVIPMYNFQPLDTRIVPMHNFAKNTYALHPDYRPLHNFWRGASYNTSQGY